MITDVRASQMFLLLHEAESVASIARRLKMSGKTIRKYRDADKLPSQIERAERGYRTRKDPLAEFWDEIVVLLEGIVGVFKVANKDASLTVYPALLILTGVAILIGLGVFQRLAATVEKDVGKDDDKEESFRERSQR